MARPTLYVARVEDIGPALKDLRRAHDVSQLDFAEAAGIHVSHVGTYERGNVCPNSRKLIEFMAAHNYVLAFVPRELAMGGSTDDQVD